MDYYFEHHGIKGQKWGVRRFQNRDGTRTAAGKKREASMRGVTGSQETKVSPNKYRNADGTLTEKGKRRYDEDAA